MSRLKVEPPAPVESLEELLAIANAMEEEAAARYTELADRMRTGGHATLAEVFERLAREEAGHIENVVRWSRAYRGGKPDPRKLRWSADGTFDDEGAATIAPQLLDAYRSLAMAVRNEERAFAFWTYVAAQAPSDEIRTAAERMACDELQHAATLRRERRRAFYVRRAARPAVGKTKSFADLENLLARRLEERAESAAASEADTLSAFADEARALAGKLEVAPLGEAKQTVDLGDGALNSVDALCELLAELYIEAGETLESPADRGRAQEFAEEAIRRLAIVRSFSDRASAT